MTTDYTLYTLQLSPYSDKIRAILAYKALPFTEHIENFETRFSVLQARTGKTMVPVLLRPEDGAMNDSTKIADYLEEVQPDPAISWYNLSWNTLGGLLEDYADEWLVRIMLASRWYHEKDALQAAAVIAAGMTQGVFGLDYQRVTRDFPPSIISSIPKMGATPENAEAWYATVPRILDALGTAVEASGYATGGAPHLCDFALYGMWNQIRRDATGAEWIKDAPRSVHGWFERFETECKVGLSETQIATPSLREGCNSADPLEDPTAVEGLFREAATTYFRMSIANAVALDAGEERVQVELADGFAFDAPPARYNRKLLAINLDRLEHLYASGERLPGNCDDILAAELSRLVETGSELITERPALGEHLAGPQAAALAG